MTAAAMLIHRDRLHACAARLRPVALHALDNTTTFRSDDTGFAEMHGMIEFQVGPIGSRRISKHYMFDRPFRLSSCHYRRQQQADFEIGMCVKKIARVL